MTLLNKTIGSSSNHPGDRLELLSISLHHRVNFEMPFLHIVIHSGWFRMKPVKIVGNLAFAHTLESNRIVFFVQGIYHDEYFN